MNSLPKAVTRQRRDCDLNSGPSAPESSALTTRLPSRRRSTLSYSASTDARRAVVKSVNLYSPVGPINIFKFSKLGVRDKVQEASTVIAGGPSISL